MPTAGPCARQTDRTRRTPSTPSPSPKLARAYSLLVDAQTRRSDVTRRNASLSGSGAANPGGGPGVEDQIRGAPGRKLQCGKDFAGGRVQLPVITQVVLEREGRRTLELAASDVLALE